MTQSSGYYYAPSSSQQNPAELRRTGDTIFVINSAGETLHQQDIKQCDVSTPLAGLPYKVLFNDGACYETLDQHSVESLFKEHFKPSSIHFIEQHILAIALAVIAIPLLVFFALKFAMPIAAQQLAPKVPQSLLTKLDQTIIEAMDKQMFSPTRANPTLRANLNNAWARLPNNENLTLLARHGGEAGANAFAMPGGHIVVTDQLLDALQNENEILAVLSHESGHVFEYHGLRNIIRSLGTAAVISAVIGDASWVAELVLVSVPTLMGQLSYSRELEQSADDYAKGVLLTLNLPSSCLGAGLTHLLESHKEDDNVGVIPEEELTSEEKISKREEEPEPNEEPKRAEEPASTLTSNASDSPEKEKSWRDAVKDKMDISDKIDFKILLDYLSTHPETEARIKGMGGEFCPQPNH